jgi:CBS domain-containing protein
MLDQKVREIMTPHPVCLPTTATVVEAAAQMRANNIGDVIIIEGNALAGIVTDRDIVVRAIAIGLDPTTTTLQDIGTGDPVAIGADDPTDEAVMLMRERAMRRLPVTNERREVVGVLSLGDLAEDREPGSTLADISAAPPNN